LYCRRRRESEGSKNKDKKVVMVKLINTEKKTTRFRNNKKLFALLCIQSWYWHISRSSDVVSPGNWLLSSDWFLLSTVLAIIER
jgi:hypothetical protein